MAAKCGLRLNHYKKRIEALRCRVFKDRENKLDKVTNAIMK